MKQLEQIYPIISYDNFFIFNSIEMKQLDCLIKIVGENDMTRFVKAISFFSHIFQSMLI